MAEQAPSKQGVRHLGPGGAENVDYLATIVRRWKLCIAAPLALAVAAYFICMLVQPKYRAEAVVATTAVDFGGDSMNQRIMPTSSLKLFFVDAQAVGPVMAQFDLEAKYGITEERFLDELLVQSPKRVETVTLSALMPTAELARDVTNALAQAGAANYHKRMRAPYDEMLAKHNADADQAKTDLEKTEQALADFHATAGLDMVRSRVAVLANLRAEQDSRLESSKAKTTVTHAHIATYEQALAAGGFAPKHRQAAADALDLKGALAELNKIESDMLAAGLEARIGALRERIDIATSLRSQRIRRRIQIRITEAATGERITKLEERLEDSPATINLKRRLVDEPALQQALGQLSAKDFGKLLALQLDVAVLDPLHSSLTAMLATARVSLGGVLAERAEIESLETESQRELPILRKQLLDLEQELRPASHRRSLAHSKFAAAGAAIRTLQATYAPAAKRLVAARESLVVSEAERAGLEAAKQACETRLKTLRVQLADLDRQLGQKHFERAQARSVANSTLAALQQVRNVSMWPPQRLTIVPASRPRAPCSPRRARIALVVLLGSFLLACPAAWILDRRKRLTI